MLHHCRITPTFQLLLAMAFLPSPKKAIRTKKNRFYIRTPKVGMLLGSFFATKETHQKAWHRTDLGVLVYQVPRKPPEIPSVPHRPSSGLGGGARFGRLFGTQPAARELGGTTSRRAGWFRVFAMFCFCKIPGVSSAAIFSSIFL